jgi:PAS domain S-box-containing protein
MTNKPTDSSSEEGNFGRPSAASLGTRYRYQYRYPASSHQATVGEPSRCRSRFRPGEHEIFRFLNDLASANIVCCTLMDINPEIAQILDAAGKNSKSVNARTAAFAAVMDALPEALYLFNSDKRLVRVNNAGTRLENRAAIELDGQRCCDMLWAVGGGKDCVVDRALERDEPAEIELLTGTNRDHPTLIKVFPIKDTWGNSTGSAIVTASDVSELRAAEKDALERKAFMSSLADLSPDEIYALDLEGRINWMNERAEAANNYLLTGVLRRPVAEFIALDSQPLAAEVLRRTLTGEEVECELQTLRTNEEMRDVEVHTAPLWRDGTVTGALVYMRDVTERKRAQTKLAQSDKLRSVGELAAGVAHNLNNVLTVIQSRAQLLLRKAEGDQAVTNSLEAITRAVSDGSQTLRRIMNFARRDPTDQLARVNLQEVLNSSIEISRPKWAKAAGGQGVTVNLENNGPVYALGDASELNEVLINFIFNAVDAMPDGGTIDVGSVAEFDAACFWVADTGVGMPPEIVKRIFEPFFSTKGDNGTGLGLSASQGIIARHGGRCTVLSAPGEGTRIEVRLPLYAAS